MQPHFRKNGSVCFCPWHNPVEKFWRTASRVEEMRENPNRFLRSEVGQRVLDNIERLMQSNESVDALADWIVREARRGQLMFEEDGKAKAVREVDFDKETKQPIYEEIGEINIPHMADLFASNSRTRRGVDLGSLSSEEAIKLLDDWDEELASGMGQEIVDDEYTKTIHQFDDGWRIVQFIDDKGCDLEGDAMGHCIGESSQYQVNRQALLSLRDPKNIPHATLELIPPDDPETGEPMVQEDGFPEYRGARVEQIQGRNNMIPLTKYRKYLKEWFASFPEEERPRASNDTISIRDPQDWDSFQLWRDPEKTDLQSLHPVNDHDYSLTDREAIEYGLRLDEPAYERASDEPSWDNLVRSLRDEFVDFESDLGDAVVYEHICPNCYNEQKASFPAKLDEEGVKDLLSGESGPFQVNENGNCPGNGRSDCNQPLSASALEVKDLETERKRWQERRNEMMNNLPEALREEEQFGPFQEAIKGQLFDPNTQEDSFENAFYTRGIYQTPESEELGDSPSLQERFENFDDSWREDYDATPQEQWLDWDLLKTLAPDLLETEEGLLTRYPSLDTIHPEDRRRQIRHQWGPVDPNQLQLPGLEDKTSAVPPVYYRWSFDPKVGVALSHNEGKIDALMNYRDGSTADSVDGYAYRIGNGWRLTDREHRPVEDPYVVSQVVRKLQSFENPKQSRKVRNESYQRPSQRHSLRQRRERVLGRRRQRFDRPNQVGPDSRRGF
jgi:hypothetical protein